MLPLLLFCLPLAVAHPGSAHASGSAGGTGRATYGQRVVLNVAPDSVEMEYVAEVPAAELYRQAREDGGADFIPRTLRDLGAGVILTFDGAPLRLESVPVADPARSVEAAYVELHVATRAALPSPTGRLAVRIGNFPDELCYFATEARISGALVVVRSSLAAIREGRLRDNRHGAWLKDEEGRIPWLEIRPARFWEQGEAAALPERMEGLHADRPPWWVIAAGILLLFPIGWTGTWLGGRARRARRP